VRVCVYVCACVCACACDTHIYTHTHTHTHIYIYVSRGGRVGYVMGWLRSVGSIKLYVSFAEYFLFYRALLQKRPIILSILLTEATHRAARRHLQYAFNLFVCV